MENGSDPLSIGCVGPLVGDHGPVRDPSIRDTLSERDCRSRRTSRSSPRSSMRVVDRLECSVRKNGTITPSRTAPTPTMAITSALTADPIFSLPTEHVQRAPRAAGLRMARSMARSCAMRRRDAVGGLQGTGRRRRQSQCAHSNGANAGTLERHEHHHQGAA